MVTHEIKGKLEGEPRSPKSWSKGLFILRENILVVDPIISGRQHELRASKTFTPFGRVSSALGRTQRRNVLREQDGLTRHHVPIATPTEAGVKLHFWTDGPDTPFTSEPQLQWFKEHVPSPETEIGGDRISQYPTQLRGRREHRKRSTDGAPAHPRLRARPPDTWTPQESRQNNGQRCPPMTLAIRMRQHAQVLRKSVSYDLCKKIHFFFFFEKN